MLNENNTTSLPKSVRHALNAVRRRLRAYVFGEGLSLVVLLFGAAFWLGLLLDWWFEPSAAVRRASLVMLLVAGLYVCYRYVIRRAFVPISDVSAALLLERRFPQLADHVLTAVHFAAAPGRAAAYHPDLIARTRKEAAVAIQTIHGGQVFRRGPLIFAAATAAGTCLSIALFALLASDAFGFWLNRIALSDETWPRRVHLEVVGFPADEGGSRVHKLAKEDGFELLVRASLEGYVAPEVVEIRTRSEDGRRASDTLTRVGDAQAGRDEFQLYRYEFKRVAENITLDVVGGDDRVRNLRLLVVERPELHSLELECEFPLYFERVPRRLVVTGGMRIPEGTRLVLHAMSSKPLIASQVRTSQTAQNDTLTFADRPQRELRWEYGTIRDDDVLLVTATDVDGVSCREPYRVSLAVVPDEPPQIAVRLAGIGTAITPDARIPMVGKISDDYGLKDAWFEYQVDGEPFARLPLDTEPSAEVVVSTNDAFDTRAIDEATGERLLVLKPGQRLALWLKASDRYDLSDEPRAGSSQQFVLDVVTMAELLALLERRELELRQRFEAIVEKVTDTRNLLGRIEFDGQPIDSKAAAGDPSPQMEDTAQPGAAQDADTAQRALARRRLRVAGALQNITQSADEVLGVAEAFDEIHDQLTNNRVDNPEVKSRLRVEIAEPLHRIGKIRMPELAAQVQLLETLIEDGEAARPALGDALALADAILVEMRHVLERMLELETYNELVSQLRGIITDQREILRRTKERQKEKLKQLFEDDQ
jgi:hypothetical protein